MPTSIIINRPKFFFHFFFPDFEDRHGEYLYIVGWANITLIALRQKFEDLK
jgi:hypothetical protein